MHKIGETNETKDMMSDSFGSNKLDKSQELNESMTIRETSMDEYESKIHNLGGSN